MATESQGYYEDDTTVISFDDDYIDTTLTDSGDVVEWWVAETRRLHRGAHVAGLDVEWRPVRAPGPVPVLQVDLADAGDQQCTVSRQIGEHCCSQSDLCWFQGVHRASRLPHTRHGD